MQQESDVRRLKKNLKDTQAALRENVAVIGESNHRGPLEGLVLVDSTVRFTNQVLEERRRLQDENERLRKQVEALEEVRRDDGFEREKFFEGAVWLGKQAAAASEEGLAKARQIKEELRRKQGECDAYQRERLGEWAAEVGERIAKETREAGQQLLENALRNKTASERVLSASLK